MCSRGEESKNNLKGKIKAGLCEVRRQTSCRGEGAWSEAQSRGSRGSGGDGFTQLIHTNTDSIGSGVTGEAVRAPGCHPTGWAGELAGGWQERGRLPPPRISKQAPLGRGLSRLPERWRFHLEFTDPENCEDVISGLYKSSMLTYVTIK